MESSEHAYSASVKKKKTFNECTLGEEAWILQKDKSDKENKRKKYCYSV